MVGTLAPKREDIYAAIGARLASAREEAGLTQAELGARMGVSDAAVTRWEKGTNRIAIAELTRAADLLDKPVAWLLGIEAPGEDSAFAHDLHRLSPEKREIAVNVIRTLREQQRREEKDTG